MIVLRASIELGERPFLLRKVISADFSHPNKERLESERGLLRIGNKSNNRKRIIYLLHLFNL